MTWSFPPVQKGSELSCVALGDADNLRLVSNTVHKNQDKRGERRVRAALTLNLGSETAVTRDVSASGVFFEMETARALGSEIKFSAELATPGGKMMLRCKGEIVRIEPHGARVGVAVRIIESALESMNGAQSGGVTL